MGANFYNYDVVTCSSDVAACTLVKLNLLPQGPCVYGAVIEVAVINTIRILLAIYLLSERRKLPSRRCIHIQEVQELDVLIYLSGFTHSLQANSGIAPQIRPRRELFHIISFSLFSSHPVIRRCTVWTTDGVFTSHKSSVAPWSICHVGLQFCTKPSGEVGHRLQDATRLVTGPAQIGHFSPPSAIIKRRQAELLLRSLQVIRWRCCIFHNPHTCYKAVAYILLTHNERSVKSIPPFTRSKWRHFHVTNILRIVCKPNKLF